MLHRLMTIVRNLALGNKSLARLSIWLQEKMQDEIEAQEELERRKQGEQTKATESSLERRDFPDQYDRDAWFIGRES